jgi:hypothetical protein
MQGTRATDQPSGPTVDHGLFIGEISERDDAAELRTAAETRERMAQAGDVDGLWRVVSETSWSMCDQAEIFRLLLRAIEVKAGKDPVGFSEALFARMAGLGGYLVLRSHFCLLTLLDQNDQAARSRGPLSLPDYVVEMLPRLTELQQHVAAILESQARTARLWTLAGKRRRASDGGEGAAGADHGGATRGTNGRADAVGVAPATRVARRRVAAAVNGRPARRADREDGDGDGSATGSTR